MKIHSNIMLSFQAIRPWIYSYCKQDYCVWCCWRLSV